MQAPARDTCQHMPALRLQCGPSSMHWLSFLLVCPACHMRNRCGNGLVSQEQLDVLAFQNIAERNALFCVADIVLA